MNPKDYIELKSAFTGTIDVSQDEQYDIVYPRSFLTYLDGQTLALSWKAVTKALKQLEYRHADRITLRTFHKLFDDGCWHPILCGFITFQPAEWPENLHALPHPQFQWHISFSYSISNVKKISRLLSPFGAEVCLPYSSRMRLPKILPTSTEPPEQGKDDDIPF